MMAALLVRALPIIVARRAVAAHQKLEFTLITGGGRATDIGRGPPDHLRVMTAHFPGGTPTRGRAAVPIALFGGPAIHHVGRRIVVRAAGPKVLTLARSLFICRVDELGFPAEGSPAIIRRQGWERRQMVGLTLRAGG
jgi:hypothetical protein